MLSQTSRTLWLDYPDKYTKIGFTRRLHLWWPLLLCRAIANGFHPTTHKVNLQASKAIILPKTKASCHSHHLGQFALPETHWPLWVSGCGPYLNPYLNIYTTHHHEVSPRDSWNYAYHTTNSCFIPYPPPLSQNIQFSCKFSTNQPTKIHVLFMPTYQLLVHKIQATIYIHML